MKRIAMILTGLCFALTGFSQTDSTLKTEKAADTIRIGGIVIIKKSGKNDNDSTGSSSVSITSNNKRNYKPKNVSTNWWIVDLGINQMRDNTNYAQSIANGYLGAGANEDWFDQKNGKSINVNIWAFMQRLNIIKHVVNLKYGLGVELNNYRYRENIKFQDTRNPLVIMDAITYRKNKLAADYVTVPMMLNFNFTPNRKNGFGFSAGASVGYLYSARQKTISNEFGKKKDREDFDLRDWKVSYIGELSLGPVKLYGSYASQSIFKNALDHTPYNVGFRLSSW